MSSYLCDIHRLREMLFGTSGRSSSISASAKRHTWIMWRNTKRLVWSSKCQQSQPCHNPPVRLQKEAELWAQKYISAPFQYQLETEQLSEKLSKLNSSLDPKLVSKNGNAQTLLQLQVLTCFFIVFYLFAPFMKCLCSEYLYYTYHPGRGEWCAEQWTAAGRAEKTQHHHCSSEAATQRSKQTHHPGVSVWLGHRQGGVS